MPSDIEKKEALLDAMRNSPVPSIRQAAIAEEWVETLPDPVELTNTIKKEIAPGGNTQPQQAYMPFAPMPTDLCRVSPFFPLNRNDITPRPYIEGMTITSSSWGSIRYTGPKLSTYDEDILLAVIALIDSSQGRQDSELDGNKTYGYSGPILPIIKLSGCSSGGKANYDHVRAALKRMTVAGIELTISKRTTRGKHTAKYWHMVSMLSLATWDEDKKELRVVVNPYFYEMYFAGSVTLIDVMKRSKLKSPVAKALLRFVESHRDSTWEGHFITLAKAMNLDAEQTDAYIRRQIKSAISVLMKEGILSGGSGFRSKVQDVVILKRASREKTCRKKSVKCQS